MEAWGRGMRPTVGCAARGAGLRVRNTKGVDGCGAGACVRGVCWEGRAEAPPSGKQRKWREDGASFFMVLARDGGRAGGGASGQGGLGLHSR